MQRLLTLSSAESQCSVDCREVVFLWRESDWSEKFTNILHVSGGRQKTSSMEAVCQKFLAQFKGLEWTRLD